MYRYVVFAGTQSGGGTGSAEILGNDMMLTMGRARYNTPEGQAVNLMHELGHTLGLLHGGADNILFKPNYRSIMNDTVLWPDPWTFEDANRNGVRDIIGTDASGAPIFELDRNGDGWDQHDSTWSLDYSREAYPTLDETNLIEIVGIQGHPEQWTQVGPLKLSDPFDLLSRLEPQVVREVGPVDWDRDGTFELSVMSQNINVVWLGRGLISRVEVHESHVDWSNLTYYFLESGDLADSVHESVEIEDITAGRTSCGR